MIQKYFRRFEMKYQISMAERDKLTQYIKSFMSLDSHSQKYGDYEVRSLYFDSISRRAYYQKLDGLQIRRKLRIRYYPNLNSLSQKLDLQKESVFLEIKRKHSENVSKARIQVPYLRAMEIIKGESKFTQLFYQTLSPQDQQTLQEIWFLSQLHHLKPAVMVCYRRQAFQGNREKRFRITFDTDVRVRNMNFDLKVDHGTNHILPLHHSIMEVKFNEHIPNWAILILQNNNCWQEKISKFARGIHTTQFYPIF